MNEAFSNPDKIPDKHFKVNTWNLAVGKEILYKTAL
jgi:hypothetical protein